MTSTVVPFLDVGGTYREIADELDAAARRVMASGWYLLGPELEKFENEFAPYVGATACAGVGSGLDALVLALRALDIGNGDEVIVPSNTYIATWLAVSAVGAEVIPVEPDEMSYNLTGPAVEAAMTPRTAAILPVHLYGRPADVVGIGAVAERHAVPIVYDAAQAHGAQAGGVPIGAFGDVVAWSFYPGKNLGAFADGGAVTSSDPVLIDRVKRLRNYGSQEKYVNVERGVNSRLDELQAAYLSVKLKHLDAWNHRRRQIAADYLAALEDTTLVLPEPSALEDSAWHLFVVQTPMRDALQRSLSDAGVQTLIHYPIPPHRQEAYADLALDELDVATRLASRVLSLPIGPHMGDRHVQCVLDAVRSNSHASS